VKLKKLAAAGAVLGVAVAGFGAAAPASADPVTDGYVIVGSDTLQDAVGALANGFKNGSSTVRTLGLGKVVASWDAFAPGVAGGIGTIQTKAVGPVYPRPSGSGNGKAALIASYTGNPWVIPTTNSLYNNVGLAGSYQISGQVDASRSSSEASVNTNGAYQYLPFGQDAVSYAFKAGANVDSASLSYVQSLTTAQLNAIYASSTNTTIPGGNSDVIVPRLPQNGSGTRSFWLTAIGSPTLGAAANGSATTLPENNGTVLAPASDEIWIIPFSVASYIARANGVTASNTTSGISLGSPNGVTPISGTAPNLAGVNTFYNGSYGRTTYIVVPWARITPSESAYDAGLAAALNPSSTSSLTYWGSSSLPSTSKAVKIKFGFQEPANPGYRAN